MKIIITIEIKPSQKPKKKSPAVPKQTPSQSSKTINIINHN